MKLSRLLALLFCIFLFASCIIVQDIGLITPTNLIADLGHNGEWIYLSWDDNSTLEDGFRIERSIDSSFSNSTIVGEVKTDINIYPDKNPDHYMVHSGIYRCAYFYRIYAFKGDRRSSYSNIAHVEY